MADRDLTPEEFADALGEMAPNLAKEGLSVNDEAAAKLLGNIVPNVKAIKTSVNKGIKIQGGSLNALLAPFKLIGSGFKTSLKTFGIDIAKFTSDVKGTFKKLGDKLNLKKQIGDAFSARFKKLQDAIKKPFTSIKNAFSKVGNFFGFKSKEQREEEEAKNPAKFVIRYLRKNIEPLLKKLSGVSAGEGRGFGISDILGSLTGKLPFLLGSLGTAVAGLLAFFGFEGTAGAGFAQIFGSKLTTLLGEGSAFLSKIGSSLKGALTGLGSSIRNSIVNLGSRMGLGAVQGGGIASRVPGGRGTEIAIAGRQQGALSKAARAAGLPSLVGGTTGTPLLPGVTPAPKTGLAKSLDALRKGGDTLKGGINKFFAKLIRFRLFAPVIEGVLGSKDITKIVTAINLTEGAKQELIGKRIVQGVAGVFSGIGGAKAGAIVGSVGGPIGTILGAIAGAFGGDYLGRKIVSEINDSVGGFSEIGSLFYGIDPELDKKNLEKLSKFEGVINPRTGLSASVMFDRTQAEDFISAGGNVSGLRQNLLTEARIKEIQKAAKTVEVVQPDATTNGNGTTINDNSQSNATEVNNFVPPGEVQPRNPDPVPDPVYTGGYGQLATG